MNINGGFFSDTEGDALAEMQKMVSCKVNPKSNGRKNRKRKNEYGKVPKTN